MTKYSLCSSQVSSNNLESLGTRKAISSRGSLDAMFTWCHVSTTGLPVGGKKRRGRSTVYTQGVQEGFAVVQCYVVSDSLSPHGLQHTRLPCPSLSPGACSNSCPLSWWYHPIISSSVIPFSSYPQSLPASGFFSNESALCIRRPKCWSFSISSSNEYSRSISFRIDLFDLLVVHGMLKSPSPAPQFESINSLALNILYSLTLTSIPDYWKNHSFDYMDLCQQSDVSPL